MPSTLAVEPGAAKNGSGSSISKVSAETGGSTLARWSKYTAYVAVLPLLLYFAPHVYKNKDTLLIGIVYLVLAQGVNVIYGFTGYLPFGYVGFFGAGAYGMYIAVHFFHANGLFSMLFGGVTSVAVSVLLLPLLRLSGAYFALATLAASQALYYVISNSNQTITKVTGGPYGTGTVLSAIYSEDASYVAGVILLAVAIAVVVYLRNSHFGLSLRAVKADPLTAEVAGINVPKVRGIAWLISAALAGLAGAVFAWITSVFYPDTVFSLPTFSVLAIVFALFGGVGTIYGPLIGGIFLYGLYNYIGLSHAQYFQLIFGVLIVALMLFLPGGLASIWRGFSAKFLGKGHADAY